MFLQFRVKGSIVRKQLVNNGEEWAKGLYTGSALTVERICYLGGVRAQENK